MIGGGSMGGVIESADGKGRGAGEGRGDSGLGSGLGGGVMLGELSMGVGEIRLRVGVEDVGRRELVVGLGEKI